MEYSPKDLWKRANDLIPGGNSLLSKNPELFAPDQWPTYFSKAKGCEVWDLNGNKFTDIGIMGVGTNLLGFANEEVDSAVHQAILNGNISTLNCLEEVELAERLVSIHPWSDMARFARTGGEANAIAVRIARAATNKDSIAVCGYHGWHDWYLASNLIDSENLKEHLLPGLDPVGVPSALKNTVYPFNFNNINQLKKIISENNLAAVKMEVMRSFEPQNGFLEEVRKLCTENGIVLIFDECTSGFRETFGGLHKKYKINPDIAIFGKTLGNGYPITAVIGIRDIMIKAKETFISSTFWSERIGPVAALKTLEIMERDKTWISVTDIGKYMKNRWSQIAKKFDLKIKILGLPSLSTFSIESKDQQFYKTLIIQEMLKYNFLSPPAFYASTAHNKEIIDDYCEALEKVFLLIKKCEEGLPKESLLKGPICNSGFKRLN